MFHSLHFQFCEFQRLLGLLRILQTLASGEVVERVPEGLVADGHEVVFVHLWGEGFGGEDVGFKVFGVGYSRGE